MTIRTAILALSLACGAPAFAAPASDEATVSVRIDDLDLASTNGRELLDARVMKAARRLCRSGLRGIAELALQTECIAKTVAGAKAQTEQAIAQAGHHLRLAALSVKAGR